MSVRIIDTFQDIDQCFTDAGFCKEKWDQYIRYYLPYAKKMIEKDGRNIILRNKFFLSYEYIRVIENQESHQKFFGDWCSYLNLSLREIETILYECIDR